MVRAFVTFDFIHIITLILFFGGLVVFIKRGRDNPSAIWQRSVKIVLVTVLLGLPAAGVIWYLAAGTFTLAKSLPLELCHITAALAAYFFIKPSQAVYEMVFFWTTAGTVQGLLTPYIGPYGFPHFWFFQFFLWHFAIVFAWAYMTYVMDYRPRIGSIRRAFFLTNGLCVPIVIINIVTQGNYFFLMRPPETLSIIDYLGPWPFYFITLQFVGAGSFYLYYWLVQGIDKLELKKTSLRRSLV